MRRVRHLGVEHQPVEASRVVSEHGERCRLAGAHHTKPVRQLRDAVAVAHPHLLTRALVPYAVQQRTVADDVYERAAKFAMVGALRRSAQLRAHHHLAVADAQHRHALLEHQLRRARRFALVDAGGAARQDIGTRTKGADALRIGVERPDLAIDAGFTQPPRDQLRELRAEIEN